MPTGAVRDTLNNSISKAITILNSFSYERPRLRLKEVSALTGLNQATAYRMLLTLKEFNLIEQHEGFYSLGRGILRYEGIVLHSMEIRRTCLPYLAELSHQLKANVNLAVLDGNEVVYVARAETPYCLYGYFHIGMRRPIHCTALGKVLVSRTPEIIQEVFQGGVTRLTLNTKTSISEYMEEIERVRLQGYALDLEELCNGINCVAAPIYDASGGIAAAISISGPTSIYPAEEIRSCVPALIDYAHRLSARMGSRGGW